MIVQLIVQGPSKVLQLTTATGVSVVQAPPGVSKVIQLGIQGPAGPQGDDAAGSTLTSGETLGGGKVVYAGNDGKVYLASHLVLAQAGLILGFTNAAAPADSPIPVVTAGAMTMTGLTSGATYFLGTSGLIVKAGDVGFPTTGFLQGVGTAASATLLIVQIAPPIIL